MKRRNFYPRQVLRALQGEHAELDAGQRAVLLFAMRKGRRLGYSVSCFTAVPGLDLLAGKHDEITPPVIANCPVRIRLHPSV